MFILSLVLRCFRYNLSSSCLLSTKSHERVEGSNKIRCTVKMKEKLRGGRKTTHIDSSHRKNYSRVGNIFGKHRINDATLLSVCVKDYHQSQKLVYKKLVQRKVKKLNNMHVENATDGKFYSRAYVVYVQGSILQIKMSGTETRY